MFDWISHNKELFLQSHTEIGVSYQHALDLQTQHNHFAMNSMVSWGHAVTSAGVRRGPAQEATCSAQGSMDLWEVMWGRSGWLWQQQSVALSTQALICGYFLDLRAAQSCGVCLHFEEQIQYFLSFWCFFDWKLMQAVGGTLIIYASPSTPC